MPNAKSAVSALSSSRLALRVGFGGLLVIMALSGFDALRVLDRFRQADSQIRRQFLFRNRVLNDIRSGVYLSGTYVRDYVLDPDPQRAAAFGASLKNVHRHMESDLGSYARQLEPEQSEQYAALRADLDQYWQILQPVLRWNAEERQQRGYAFLRDEVFPRRTAMLEVAGRIAEINDGQVNTGNQRASELLAQFQTRLAITMFAALALGLGMAVFSTRKILHLEAQAYARYQEVVEARTQLTSLSARLVEAQETERRSLSRELHDEVGQSLSAALVELRGLLVARPELIRGQVERVKALVESTVGVVRNMALLLRPSMLDDLGLIPALRWQAREVSKRTGMDVTVSTELDSEDLPDEYKTCIYRVVQEALNNCSRHSHATTVRIRVQRRPGTLAVSIQDDGTGFDAHQSKGLGLLGIEERAAQFGGVFHVHSGPEIGTILTLELPFTALPKDHIETDSNPVSG
jgi:signal transduction histidine kinase